MTEPERELDPLARELAYYRREYDELGSRLLRLQEEQSRATREARRSRTVARLLREAYALADCDLTPDRLGAELLAVVADVALCDRVAALRETDQDGVFVVDHAIGLEPGATLILSDVPPFLYTAHQIHPVEPARALTGLLGVPSILWAYDAARRRALLLGNQRETHVHRAFEPGDRELVSGALAVYVDVQLRKLAEITLRQAKGAAEQANVARARFLAALTHELRTPLNAIIGFSELLLEDGARAPTPPQRREYAGQILDAGRHLLVQVNDILDYSSLAEGKPVLRRDWIGAAAFLDSVARAFRAQTGHTGTVILTSAPDPDLELFIDYDRARQLLANLVGNAVKFTEGGRIDLVCESLPDGAILLYVRDTGIGIYPEDIPRALEPFVQIDSALHRRFRGTGLGLPIARQLAEAHGGTLSIESTPGRGTTVSVTFPAGTARRADLRTEPHRGPAPPDVPESVEEVGRHKSHGAEILVESPQ